MPTAVQLFFNDIFEKSDEVTSEVAQPKKAGESSKKKKGKIASPAKALLMSSKDQCSVYC